MSVSGKFFKMIILGAPGSGKGTISARVVRDFGLAHLSSGDVLRSQLSKKTELGLVAGGHMASGELVPDALMVGLMGAELGAVQTRRGWLLDGFPRTLSQAKALGEMHQIDLVVSLDVPFATIVDRIKGRWVHPGSGRVYNTDFQPPKQAAVTEPLLDFYRGLGVVRGFRGTETNVLWPLVKECVEESVSPL